MPIFLSYIILVSLSLFLLLPLCFHVLLHQGIFPIKLALFHFSFFLMLPINFFPRTTNFFLGNFAPLAHVDLENPSQSLMLIMLLKFLLNSNITLFINLPWHLNPSLLMQIFEPLHVWQHVNVVRSVFFSSTCFFFSQFHGYHCKPCLSCDCLKCYKICQFSTSYLWSVSTRVLYCKCPLALFSSET